MVKIRVDHHLQLSILHNLSIRSRRWDVTDRKALFTLCFAMSMGSTGQEDFNTYISDECCCISIQWHPSPIGICYMQVTADCAALFHTAKNTVYSDVYWGMEAKSALFQPPLDEGGLCIALMYALEVFLVQMAKRTVLAQCESSLSNIQDSNNKLHLCRL